MANDKKRMVSTHFWNDTFTAELEPIEKLLFLYLLTNDQTNMLGVYELALRRIAFDTGIDKDMVLKIFELLKVAEKAEYTQGFVILYNFSKHQKFNNNMVQSALKVCEDLPEAIMVTQGFGRVIQGFRTLGDGFEIYKKEIEIEIEIEKEKEKEIESEIKKENETKNESGLATRDVMDFDFFLNEWNQVYSTNLKMTHSKKQQIKQRLKTFSVDELIQSIHKRRHDHWLNHDGKKHMTSWDSFWRNDEKVERYLNTPIDALQHSNTNQSYANRQATNQKQIDNAILSGEITI